MNIKRLLCCSTLVIFFSNVQAAGGDVANGGKLARTCAACHAADGNSVNPVWPKLAGQHASYIAKQLADFKSGKRVNAQMTPLVMGLSDQDMRDLGAYFAGKKTKLASANPDLIEQGQTLYRAGNRAAGVPACMACHGPSGEGNPGALYPKVSAQHAPYTLVQLKDFKSEARSNDKNGVMRSIAARMSNAQIEAVAEYIQGLR